jgi:predicted HD superfamily hydrolase involved in NAD metabolism
MTDNEYKKLIKSKLTEKRYLHSLAVADEAEKLAVKYGCDRAKAYTAGLLHDIMKDSSREDMLQIFEEFDIMLSNVERAAFKLWHAIAGSAYIKNVLGVDDEDIINAVRYHTTARAGMSTLEKVIYLADFTSADRDYDGVDEMRAAVKNDLPQAMMVALKFSVLDLMENNRAIHPDTMYAYNELVL